MSGYQYISDTAEIVRLQEEAIKEHSQRVTAGGQGQLLILEAGCGQKWLLDLAGVDYKLSGIDMDPDALAIRKDVQRDLDEAIVGDLCTLDLHEASFDVVYSNFVLEHIERADIALDNMVRWLRPGGVLVMMIPDPLSVRGYFTRLLPFPAHVWYHRYVKGRPHAGESGHAPYPTHFTPYWPTNVCAPTLRSAEWICMVTPIQDLKADGSCAHFSPFLRGPFR